MREKLVRLSNLEYKQVERAREELVKKGIENLPDIKPLCPKCGEPLEGFKFSNKNLKCSKCEYTENNVVFTAVGAFALGAIIGLAAAALIYLLTKNENDKEDK